MHARGALFLVANNIDQKVATAHGATLGVLGGGQRRIDLGMDALFLQRKTP